MKELFVDLAPFIIMIIEYFLGKTKRIKANSILEIPENIIKNAMEK